MFTAKKQMLVLFRSLEEQGVEAGLSAGKPFVVRDFVDFAQEYEMGATIPFLRSQVGVKNDEDAKVLKVTGDTFEELVRAPKSAVMVSFNAQVCPPCENVNKILTNLAEE